MALGTFKREAAVPFSSEVLCARTRAQSALRYREHNPRRGDDGQDRATHTEQLSVRPRQARDSGCEQHAIGNSHRAGEGHVTQEPHYLVDALVAAELSTDEESAHPLAQFGFGLRRVLQAHETPRGRPLAHILVGTSGNRTAPTFVRAQERLGEREMHPFHETGVRRRIGMSAGIRLIGSRDSLVHPADARRLLLRLHRRAVRDADDPAHGTGQAPYRILAVAREVVHTGHRAGMKRLDEQRPDACDEGRGSRVDRPDRAPVGKVPVVVAVGDITHPLRRAVWIARERGEQPRAKCGTFHRSSVPRRPDAGATRGQLSDLPTHEAFQPSGYIRHLPGDLGVRVTAPSGYRVSSVTASNHGAPDITVTERDGAYWLSSTEAWNYFWNPAFTVTLEELPDLVRPQVALISPTTAGPFQALSVRGDATDNKGLQRIVANIYKDGKLVKSTQSAERHCERDAQRHGDAA